jgi:predicted alpha/beta-hydrolase family hydrolase
MFPSLRKRRFGLLWRKRPDSCPRFPLSPAANPSAAAWTSQAQAASALPDVCGLAFLGFPLHPAGRLSDERAEHLFKVKVPMLFLQGTRDKLADVALLERLTERLGARASLQLFQDADHSFHVPVRAGRKDADVRREMMDTLAAWTFSVTSKRG